jgi:hypothetical protein
MTNGPLTSAFALGHDTALRQELTTYSVKNGNLVRTTVTRVYSKDRDYIDSTSTVIMGETNGKI